MTVPYRLLSGTVALVLLAGTLASCTTGGEPSRGKTGALTGGLIGAGAGALIDKDNPARGALIGAAAGGAIGGGIGHMIQRQKVAFDKIEGLETQQQTVMVQQPVPPAAPGAPVTPAPEPQVVEKPSLLLRMNSDVLFPVGSSALSDVGRMKVREIADVLKQYPDSDVFVRGYTSSEGEDQMNFELSQRRAEIVRNELIANGVDPTRVDARGMGESNPIATNDTEAGRIQNRRVDINVVPRGNAM